MSQKKKDRRTPSGTTGVRWNRPNAEHERVKRIWNTQKASGQPDKKFEETMEEVMIAGAAVIEVELGIRPMDYLDTIRTLRAQRIAAQPQTV